MPEQTEKLLHFTEEVVRNAAQQSEQLKKELEQERAAALAEAKIEAKDAARSYYDKEAARIRAESGREVSRHLMESKRKIYLRRKEITQEVFQQVCERIRAFTQTDDYCGHMEQQLQKAMELLPGAQAVTVQLRAEDMSFAPRLSAALAPVEVECQEGTFSLGGFIVQCSQLGLRVDCSFDNRLEELAGHFAESFGLSLSDDLDEM